MFYFFIMGSLEFGIFWTNTTKNSDDFWKIFAKCENWKDLFKIILGRSAMNELLVTNEIPPRLQIFDLKKMRYQQIFETQIRRKSSKQRATKCENEASLRQIKNIFNIILHKSIPGCILGSRSNKKKILKNYIKFLRTARTEYFSCEVLMNQLNVRSILITLHPESFFWNSFHFQQTSSIPWIKNSIRSDIKKKHLLKFVKWLFNFLNFLTCKYLSVLYVKEERIFLLKSDFHKAYSRHIKKMEKKKIIIKDANCLKSSVLPMFNLIPKTNGFRGIMKIM